MKPMIKVENISKQYRLGASRESFPTLRDALAGAFRAPLRRRGRRKTNETIWALKDVSFEIAPGEVVGIIGRNGAGKSTLLKILSRITEPTSGRAELHGRTASLLEVGTGFHPELTGRENMFLNAAILGMPRSEIERKFDEIVAFAEIEKFLDTPVKHYSSGMYVRLAFAVAAHLEPEILIIDEVLAVGDAAFQKKCLGKIQGVTQQGRTVLFVSHNMAAIKSLCGRALLLEEGRIAIEGNVDTLIDKYLMKPKIAETGVIPELLAASTILGKV
jgi:homopolymeric O-antigen transport system ATP-binding protein